MASFTVVAPPACTLASSAASLAGLKVSAPPSVRPGGVVAVSPVRAVAAAQSVEAKAAENEREIMKRRALVVGAFASAVAMASYVNEAEAGEGKKKKKCPTICVQNPTASCCFGY